MFFWVGIAYADSSSTNANNSAVRGVPAANTPAQPTSLWDRTTSFFHKVGSAVTGKTPPKTPAPSALHNPSTVKPAAHPPTTHAKLPRHVSPAAKSPAAKSTTAATAANKKTQTNSVLPQWLTGQQSTTASSAPQK